MQRGTEEATAERTLYEQDLAEAAAARHQELRREYANQQAAYEQNLNQQARQAFERHVRQEQACYDARFRTLQHEVLQHAAQEREAESQRLLRSEEELSRELGEAEQTYFAMIRREAEAFAHDLREEVQYHMTSNAQAQSVLARERQLFQENLDEQMTRWTAHSQRLSEHAETVIAELVDNEVNLEEELHNTQTQLEEWVQWYEEDQQQEHFEAEQEAELEGAQLEAEEAQAAPPPGLVQAPLTPAVVHGVLAAHHLPPQQIPCFRVPLRRGEAQEANQEQQEQDARAQELHDALRQVRFLEQERQEDAQHWEQREMLQQQEAEAQREARARTATTPASTLAYPSQVAAPNATLTLGQPTLLQNISSRAPWSTTREMLSQPQYQPSVFGHSVAANSEAGVSMAASSHMGAPSVMGMAFPAMGVPQPQPQTPIAMRPTDEIHRDKAPLPKLVIKSGDPTTMTRIINEWLQKTAMALNTWSSAAVQLWHAAVSVARGAHQQWMMLVPAQRALQSGLPSTGNALPMQLSVLEATMRSELCNQVLPDKVTSLAVQKSASTVADLLFLTLLTYLPSEPSARVDGLSAIEAPAKPARTFGEALSFLRTWRQQILTVVKDLGGNPEPLKLLTTLKTLISNLVASDTSFAMEVSQMYKQTNVKIFCNDVSFLQMLELLEIELSQRAHEDDEEKRRQRSAGAVMAAAAVTTGKASGAIPGQKKEKPVCRDFLSDSGCPRGGQCTFQHPATVGRCLRCGSTKHKVSECRMPRGEPKAKGKGKGPPLPKAKPKSQSQTQAKAKTRPVSKSAPKSRPKAKAKAEAGHIELQWAMDVEPELPVQDAVMGASHAAMEPFPDDGNDYYDSRPSTFSACSFFTSYHPSFHSSSGVDDEGLLSPILDTGATHCLLPLKWLSPENAAASKRIHLKVASGATVRALLHNNLIYCTTVSRPLISVGQLKSMLDLRFVWDDAAPYLLVVSGNAKRILLEASIMHHLPVITSEEMTAILDAIQEFTCTGKVWNAKAWEDRLGRRLEFFHPYLSAPAKEISSPNAQDSTQVLFSAAVSEKPLSLDLSSFPSTVKIYDLTEGDDDTEMRRKGGIQERSCNHCPLFRWLQRTLRTSLRILHVLSGLRSRKFRMRWGSFSTTAWQRRNNELM